VLARQAILMALVLSTEGPVAADPEPRQPLSILLGDPFEVGPLLLQRLPAEASVESLLDRVFQPVVFQLPESGGFSAPDPQKLSIYGDSWAWNRWHFNGVDVSDPFFSGASALRVPTPLLTGIGLEYNEDPRNLGGGEGVSLHGRIDASDPRPTAGVMLTFPDAGGIFPLGKAVASGLHATERAIPPPDARRRFASNIEARASTTEDIGTLDLRFGIEALHGARRYLEFDPLTAAQSGAFDESYTIVSAGVLVAPKSRAYDAWILGEYRRRDNLYDELYFAPGATAEHESATLSAGIAIPHTLHAGLTLKAFSIEARDRSFSQELITPSGEALEPWYPSGRFFAGNLDATLEGSTLYLTTNDRFLAFSPSRASWSNLLTDQGAPYGRIDWRSNGTFEVIGHKRIGTADHLASGPFSFAYDAFASLAYGLNDRLVNSLVFADVGVGIEARYQPIAPLSFFLHAAKTPAPITGELVRLLDPNYLSGSRYLGASELIDTTGGDRIRAGSGLRETNIYTLALGLSAKLLEGWRFQFQGLLKLYRDTPWIAYDGTPSQYGRFVDGIFYLGDGPKSYRLVNDPLPLGQQPEYFGLHFQLANLSSDAYFVSMGFSVVAAVGVSPFGNGPTVNDAAAVDWSSANPNTLLNGYADLDGDRLYVLKSLFGWRIADRLWAVLDARFMDGEPFAFFLEHQDRGQVALTYAGTRGSPLKGPPLSGPRKDSHLEVDLRVQYSTAILGPELRAALWIANLLDFGNELAELSNANGRTQRDALELEIPRSIMLSLELAL
jgi:hypothetical protein